MADTNEVKYLTLNEAAEMLKRSPKTIRRWITSKRLSAYMIGGRWCVNEHDLKRMMRLSLEEYGITERDIERCHAYFVTIGGTWEGKGDALITQLLDNDINPNAYLVLRERGWLRVIWRKDHTWQVTLQDE
jgi:excisionase family DNA binding protein